MHLGRKGNLGILQLLQRLPIACDLSPSKDSDKVAFLWTSIIEKPLKSF